MLIEPIKINEQEALLFLEKVRKIRELTARMTLCDKNIKLFEEIDEITKKILTLEKEKEDMKREIDKKEEKKEKEGKKGPKKEEDEIDKQIKDLKKKLFGNLNEIEENNQEAQGEPIKEEAIEKEEQILGKTAEETAAKPTEAAEAAKGAETAAEGTEVAAEGAEVAAGGAEAAALIV